MLYEEFYNERMKQLGLGNEQIIKKYETNIKGNALDLGCGTGRIVRSMLELSHELYVFGIDIDSDSLEIAKKDLLPEFSSRVSLIKGDFVSLEYPTKCQIITCVGNTLTSVLDSRLRLQCFQKAAKSLVTNGVFIISNLNDNVIHGRCVDRCYDMNVGKVDYHSEIIEDRAALTRLFRFRIRSGERLEDREFLTALIPLEELIASATESGFTLKQVFGEPNTLETYSKDSPYQVLVLEKI